MGLNKHCKEGKLVLTEINFDHVFKRKVMSSGKVGKIYLPKELIGKTVFVVVNLNGGGSAAEEKQNEDLK